MKFDGISAGHGCSPARLYRLSGLALLVALPLQVIGFVLHPASERIEHITSSLYGPSHTVLFGSWVLVMLGLPGLYARQAVRAGRLGLVAFVVAMAAVGYHIYLTLYEAFAIPAMADVEAIRVHLGPEGDLAHGAGALGPVAVLLVLGFPLFGVATLRARVFPRLAGWLQIAAIPVFVVGAVLLGLVLDGKVGPDGEIWVGGVLPIAVQYWTLCGGFAVAGLTLWTTSHADAHSASVPAATPVPMG